MFERRAPVVFAMAAALAPPLEAQSLEQKVPVAIRTALGAERPQDVIVLFEDGRIQGEAASLRASSALEFEDESITDFKASEYRLLKEEVWALVSSDDVTVLNDYSHLPFAFVRLRNVAALTAIASRAEVVRVYENTLYYRMLNESLPLIRQPSVAADGYTGAGTTVAVLDTGLDYTRAAFGSCTAPGVPAGCKVIYAQDFAPPDGELDADTHGTNVSGIILGVAPGTKIAALDVFDGAAAPLQAVLDAINWSIANQSTYDIVAMNLSFGSGRFSGECTTDPHAPAFANARLAGILPVVASGNDGYPDSVASPACTPGAVRVGASYDSNLGTRVWSSCTDASTAADQVACFSNSASFLTILAPGSSIAAAGVEQSGTSQAAAHVAGAAAVLKATNPSFNLDQITAAMTSTGVSVTDNRNGLVKPRLELRSAVDYALGVVVPGAATLVSPSGTVATNTPSYVWDVVSVATWYYLKVDSASGNVFNEWYPSATVCSQNVCNVSPAGTLANENYTWTVQTWNKKGYGPFSNPLSFTVDSLLPTHPPGAVLVSPSGAITTNKPGYLWNAAGRGDSAATWYYLKVDGPLGQVHALWYAAASVCNGAACGVTPDVTLTNASYNWTIQTWNTIGYGPFATPIAFVVNAPVPEPPPAATLVSPSGTITENKPAYTWQTAGSGLNAATWYFLKVDGAAGEVFSQWYQAQNVCNGATCSTTPDKTLMNGNYGWTIQTWNTVGYGPVSTPHNFVVDAPAPRPPPAATLVSPSGTMTDRRPAFTWQTAGGNLDAATWYYLKTDGGAGSVFAQWYTASSVCTGSTCAVTPALTLPNGRYIWTIQTWNPVGYGPVSAPFIFIVNAPGETPPGAALLLSPAGTLSESSPSYRWNAVTGVVTTTGQFYNALNYAGDSFTATLTLGGAAMNSLTGNWSLVGRPNCGDVNATAFLPPTNETVDLGTVPVVCDAYNWFVLDIDDRGFVLTYGTGAPPVRASEAGKDLPALSASRRSETIASNGYEREAEGAWLVRARGAPPVQLSSAATWYYLVVNGAQGNVFAKWYTAASVCSGDDCMVTPGLTLPNGDYTWTIQTWNEEGYGPMSPLLAFTIP